MSSNSRLYPYHPISGDRLAGTFEVIPAWVPREIHKTGDTITLEDGSETLVNWNGQELLQSKRPANSPCVSQAGTH